MQRSKWLRAIAAFAAISLFAAACGGDDEPAADGGDTTTTDGGDTTDGDTTDGDTTDGVTATGKGDGTLTLGYVLPESGQLQILGIPQIEAVRLAIADINAAGGALGGDVVLKEGDSGTDPAVARQTVNRLLGEGVDGIIGAAASGVSQEFIQTLHDNQIAQCSASNTSPAFSTQANADYYVRTVPPDEAVAPIIADTVVGDGASNVVILARADDYGNALADLVEGQLTSLNATVAEKITYNPDTTGFDSEVQQTQAANPDAVVIIGFGESATLIRQLVEAGLDPSTFYGADGIFDPTLEDQVGGEGGDKAIIDGMKVIGASGGADFNARLDAELSDDQKGNLIYGGQAYDCVVIMTLAAIAADSDDAADFIAEIGNVTKGGEKCTSFADCKALLEAGTDIDYDGVSGPLDLDDVGDPTFGRYAIGEFQDGGALVIISDKDADVAAAKS